MKRYILLIGMLGTLTTGYALAKQPLTAVASSAETEVVGVVPGLTVKVIIKMHEVQIGKPTDTRPTVIESSCTYSRYPCSVVDRLDIVVNGHRLFVPRSVFSDLGDVVTAGISASEGGAVLTLHGGDASESYIAKIAFDGTRVTRRTRSSASEPDEISQETTYYAVGH